MGKFARTWRLMGASWRMLVQDKQLIVFPMLSGLALAVVIVLFAVPIVAESRAMPNASAVLQPDRAMYVGYFLLYLVNYFVVIFFNAALIACVLERVNGGQPTLGYGLRCAWQRLPQILGWALLASTVGFLLRMLEQRVGFIGRLVVGLLGMAWSVTAFLVVPVLVVEGSGPIESYKRSVEMLKRTWGEQIVGNVGFGLLFVVFGIVPMVVVLFVLPGAHGAAWGWVLLAAAVVYLALLGLVQATLQTIYQAAIYLYAANGQVPAGFDESAIADSFRQKDTGNWL